MGLSLSVKSQGERRFSAGALVVGCFALGLLGAEHAHS